MIQPKLSNSYTKYNGSFLSCFVKGEGVNFALHFRAGKTWSIPSQETIGERVKGNLSYCPPRNMTH